MSAIWGVVDFNGKAISEEVKKTFKEVFSECVIDRIDEISGEDFYFACGLQYINAEARYEKLPVRNGDEIFTADAILDNREEVCARLGIRNADVKSAGSGNEAGAGVGLEGCTKAAAEDVMADGEIIRLAFDKLGRESLDLMRGAYCFAKYDRASRRVEIVNDAIGNRFVYYIVRDNVLYFASLMRPLDELLKPKADMTWMAGFLGQRGFDIFTDSETTSLEGVKRIMPAGWLTFENGRIISSINYWNPQNIKRQKKTKTDAEYREEFRTIFTASIEEAMRTDGEVAMLLSSGYDSTSVACIAAPILKKRNKKLYSFTSVPDIGYENDKSEPWEIGDESELVKKTVEFLGNVEPDFINLHGVNLWDIRKEYMKVCEFPYKSPQNMIWIHEGYKRAGEKGARIMLTGAFGNGTISFDNAYQYFIWLCRHFRFKKFIEETNALKKRNGISRKRTLKVTFKGVFGILPASKKAQKTYLRTYVNQSLLKAKGITDYIEREGKLLQKAQTNLELYHTLFLRNINFRHYGEFTQKNSLYTGVINRDPTRDKRIVEFVKSVPADQFTHNGYFRRLVREYLYDIMPPKYFIRHPFGNQSVDMKQRFESYDAHVLEEWRAIAGSDFVNSEYGRSIIDADKLQNTVNSLNFSDVEAFEIAMNFYTLNCIEYLEKHC